MARNDKGESLDVEILSFEEGFDRIIQPYVGNLKRIGVNASIRRVDPAQYERRMKSYDFDVTIQRYSLRLNPGVELRGYWGSDAAKMDGTQNLSGIADPVIDTLIEKVTEAKSRSQLVTATRAIDRVLRAGHYWVPHWYKAAHNVAYWNKFSRPATMAKYDPGVIDTWWYDSAKAAALTKPASPSAGP
jgi:microcin C transport system substrate-binding protein